MNESRGSILRVIFQLDNKQENCKNDYCQSPACVCIIVMCGRQSRNCGSISTDKLFEMMNQEFKTLGRKYGVLPNFGICCRELGGAQSYAFWRIRAQFLLCLLSRKKKGKSKGLPCGFCLFQSGAVWLLFHLSIRYPKIIIPSARLLDESEPQELYWFGDSPS